MALVFRTGSLVCRVPQARCKPVACFPSTRAPAYWANHISSRASCLSQSRRPVKARARNRTSSGGDETIDDVDEDDILFSRQNVEDGLFEESDGDEVFEDQDDADEFDEDELLAEEGGGDLLEDSWDQALVNFPTEQDEVDLTPTPEEAKRTADLKLVRADEVPEGVEVEVEEVVLEEEKLPQNLEERVAQLSVRDQEQLISNQQGYLVFEMHHMELLVAQAEDTDHLDLTDCFVLDTDTQLYSRIEVAEAVPGGMVQYLATPWENEIPGDVAKMRETEYRMLRVYFSPVLKDEGEDFLVDQEQLYCFDTKTRAMSKVPVIRLAENIQDPVLRIRLDAAYIQDASEMPDWTYVAEGGGDPAKPDDEQLGAWSAGEAGNMEERLEELELMEELDDVPDVPAVDLV